MVCSVQQSLSMWFVPGWAQCEESKVKRTEVPLSEVWEEHRDTEGQNRQWCKKKKKKGKWTENKWEESESESPSQAVPVERKRG